MEELRFRWTKFLSDSFFRIFKDSIVVLRCGYMPLRDSHDQCVASFSKSRRPLE